MPAKLRRTVIVAGVVHPAGTEWTKDLGKAITNPTAWDGEPEASSGEPPRAGKGSTVEAWREFAASVDVQVNDDATRDEIIAAVDAHNS